MITPELLDKLRQDLALAWPDDTDRCRALLAWFSAGTGRYSGFPVHEAIPGILLAELPITTVIQALRRHQADERARLGAVRHLAARRARTAEELRSIPESMRPRLLALAERQDETQARMLRESWRPPR